jgi:signal transduction histidine kinase
MTDLRDAPAGIGAADEAVLRRCVRDLVALSTLPAVWARSDSPSIAASLAEVIARMLLLDAVYVRLAGGPFEACATPEGPMELESCRRLAGELSTLVGAPEPGHPVELALWSRAATTRAVCVPLGYDAANGVMIAVASRRDFPQETERLLLGVAANAAAVVIERRKAEEHLREANRAKDEFLATLSHELRTPLNAVLGWASMLSRGLADGERTQAAIAAIERNARAQVKLIEDLLEVSRFLAGAPRLDLADVRLPALIDEAVEAVRLPASARGVRLRADTAGCEGPVRADPARLRQIVWNLLSNAIKFTPPGGEAVVTARCEGEEAVITVHDTGEGIDPLFLPHVFERFTQADGSTTREHSGLGIGLWIVRRLVELHGGSAGAASAGRGLGATFIVRLPIAGPSQPARDLERPTPV